MGQGARAQWGAVFTVATLLVMLVSLVPNRLMPRLELLVQDGYYLVRGPLTPGAEVVVAAIDEKSIDRLGRWPWPRNTLAKLVDRLREAGVGVVGFDVVFSSAETGSDNDLRLHDALARYGEAVLGYFFHFSAQGLAHLPERELAGFVRTISRSRYSGIKKAPGVSLRKTPLRRAYAVEATIDAISTATPAAGYFNFQPEVDGSVRRAPLLVKYRDQVDLPDEDDYLFPPLALGMLRQYLDYPILFWLGDRGVEKVALVGETPAEIPTNELGEMWINYYGPQQTFPHYSIVDILDGVIPREKLAGKLVVVGATAIAIEDFRPTPFDVSFSGVEIHATIIDNILSGRILREPAFSGWWLDFLGILGVGLLLLLIIPGGGALSGGIVTLGLAGLVTTSHYYLFSRYGLVLHTVPLLAEIFICAAALYTRRFLFEEREKRYIRNAFGQYMSPVVIAELIRDPAKLQLGGVRREMTAFFSDIAGFSSISEKMAAGELVEFLNEYLTEMSAIVLKYNGIVDKYEGDAIMAFFGAPLDDPQHARQCCLMALEMQERLGELRPAWQARGLPVLRVRMGINTGSMVVGNMGSRQRMDYTIMGDAVNLASRLEGVNKAYGTAIIISQATYEACREAVEVRELDAIRVVGKQEQTVIYELMARQGELTAEQARRCARYDQGLRLYRQQQWDAAIAVFGELFEADPEDGPTLTYLERCLDYRISPPGKEWDGVHVMKSK